MYYGLSKKRLDVTFTEDLRRTTEDAAAGLHTLIASGKTPPPVYEKKCTKCSIYDLCLPKIATRRSARAYLHQCIETM